MSVKLPASDWEVTVGGATAARPVAAANVPLWRLEGLKRSVDQLNLVTDPYRRASQFLSEAMLQGNLTAEGSEKRLAALWRALAQPDGFEEINPAAVLLGMVSERLRRLGGNLADLAAARYLARQGGEGC